MTGIRNKVRKVLRFRIEVSAKVKTQMIQGQEGIEWFQAEAHTQHVESVEGAHGFP